MDKLTLKIEYTDFLNNDLENYLWLFTKDYPLIYEVYNKKDEPLLAIVRRNRDL